MNDEIKALQIWVEGRVQGVFFRATTKKRAVSLGLVGYAKNLPDGSVEIVAQGPMSNLGELVKWVQKGPPLARVDRMRQTELKPSNALVEFTIER